MKLNRLASWIIVALLYVFGFACVGLAAVVNVPAGASNAKQLIEGLKSGDVAMINIGRTACDSAVVPNGAEVRASDRRRCVLVAPDGKSALRALDGSTVNLTDMRFDGTAIVPEGKSTVNADGCEFFNFRRGKDTGTGGGVALGNLNGWQNKGSKITRCLFTGDGWGVAFLRGDNWEISNNTFTNVAVPIKSNNHGDTDNNGLITKNVFTGVSGPIAEMQGCARNFRLVRNIASNFIGNSDYNLGFSIIYHGRNSDNNYAGYNIIRGSVTVPRIGFEIGDGYTVEQNLVSDANCIIACFMGDSSGPVPPDTIQPTIVQNNKCVNLRIGLGGLEGGQNPEKFSMPAASNNANVQLSWNPDVESKTWGDPYTNGTGGSTTQPTDPPPPPSFTVTAKALDKTADIKTKGAGVHFTFANAPANAKTIRIVARAKGRDDLSGTRVLIGTKDAPGVVDVPITGGDVYGFVPAWDLDVRPSLLDASGAVISTAGWINIGLVAGDVGANGSDLKWPPVTATTQPSDPLPPGDSVDEITTTTTRIRAGKVIDTTSVTVRKAA